MKPSLINYSFLLPLYKTYEHIKIQLNPPYENYLLFSPQAFFCCIYGRSTFPACSYPILSVLLLPPSYFFVPRSTKASPPPLQTLPSLYYNFSQYFHLSLFIFGLMEFDFGLLPLGKSCLLFSQFSLEDGSGSGSQSLLSCFEDY